MNTASNSLECDAILFDLDGVLIDSTPCIVRHWQAWASRQGLDIHQVLQSAHGIRTVETMRLVAPHLDVEREAEEFTAHEIVDTEGVSAIKGAYPLLAGLPPAVWAIVTSGSLDLVKARLRSAGLPLPPTLVTAEDVLHGKPDPEPYRLGASRLGVAAERCVVIEDSPAGVEAGVTAGMRVVGIASTHSPRELLEKGADLVAERLPDLCIQAASGGYRLAIFV